MLGMHFQGVLSARPFRAFHEQIGQPFIAAAFFNHVAGVVTAPNEYTDSRYLIGTQIPSHEFDDVIRHVIALTFLLHHPTD